MKKMKEKRIQVRGKKIEKWKQLKYNFKKPKQPKKKHMMKSCEEERITEMIKGRTVIELEQAHLTIYDTELIWDISMVNSPKRQIWRRYDMIIHPSINPSRRVDIPKTFHHKIFTSLMRPRSRFDVLIN